jgi:hypothetical protein
LGKAAEEPDTHVVSDKEMEEMDTWMQPKIQQLTHALTGGYHGVEIAITAYALLKTHPDELFLLHRFGDVFSHSKIIGDKNGLTTTIKLIDYVNSLDTYINSKFIFNQDLTAVHTPYGVMNYEQLHIYYDITENGKIRTSLSKEQVAHDFVDFLLQGIHASKFAGINWETYINNIVNILPEAIQNKSVMYGTNEIFDFTPGHAIQNKLAEWFNEGYSPDNIVDRTNLYLHYVNLLTQLLSIKYSKQVTNDEIKQTFSNIIDYVKYSTIDRIDGILACEIAKNKNPNKKEIIFYIPIKYTNNENLTTQGTAYNITQDFEKTAKEIRDDTYTYFDKSGMFSFYFIEDKIVDNNGAKYIRFKLTKK